MLDIQNKMSYCVQKPYYTTVFCAYIIHIAHSMHFTPLTLEFEILLYDFIVWLPLLFL